MAPEYRGPGWSGKSAVGGQDEFGLEFGRGFGRGCGPRTGTWTGPRTSPRSGGESGLESGLEFVPARGPGAREGDAGGTVIVPGVGDGGAHAGADGALGQGRGEDLDEGGAVEEDERSAEAVGRRPGVGAGEPAAPGGAHAAVALPGGERTDAVAEADDVEGALRVRGEADAGADGGEVGGAFEDRDLPASLVQGDGGGEAADAGSDDDGAALFHDCSPDQVTTGVVSPTLRPYYRCSRLGGGR